MEEKKKSNKGLIVLVVVLVIILLGLIGYICYDKFMAVEDVNNNDNNAVKNR